MWYDASMTYLARTDAFIESLDVEAYRVGGSVRDELLGRRVKDADYMVRGAELGVLYERLMRTDAKISALKLRDGRQVGFRAHKPGLGLIEIALPRTEKSREVREGENMRQAFEIVVDPALSVNDDAIRRDFTFNALYKPVGPVEKWGNHVIDPTSCGLYDLQHKLVRTTHPDSFRDDPLRTLRALRFVSTLGYDLASITREEMERHAEAVTGLSAKGYASGTALAELEKLLMGADAAKALRLARDTGVLATLLPELAPMLGYEQGSKYHDLTVDEHTFKAIETACHVDAPLRVRMSLLFHDAGKPLVAWVGEDGRKHYYASAIFQTADHEVASNRLWREAAARLNAPKSLRDDVSTLIQNHMVNVVGKIKPSKVRRARVKFGDAMLRDLYLHRMCDLSGKSKVGRDYMAKIGYLEQARQDAEKQNVPVSPRDLLIDGNDVKELGGEGRSIGRALAAVLDEVVCQPNDQTLSRDWQLERAAYHLRNGA